MKLIDKEILELIEDVKFGCGEIEYRRFTKDFKPNYGKLEDIRLQGITPEPGAKVEIYWKIFDEPDKGYIFTLPGWDSDDIFISGIIHILHPQGGEKSEEEPQWIYLNRLLSYPEVVKIKIFSDVIK